MTHLLIAIISYGFHHRISSLSGLQSQFVALCNKSFLLKLNFLYYQINCRIMQKFHSPFTPFSKQKKINNIKIYGILLTTSVQLICAR